MMDWEYTTIYFPITYGLGLIPDGFDYFGVMKGEDDDWLKRGLVGHPGEDWGSNGKAAGYNFAWDFGFSVTMGSNMGMACVPGDDWINNFMMGRWYPCEVYDISL